MHEKLCLKLNDKKIPVAYIKVFYYWCKTQRFRVNWGMAARENFRSKNQLGKEGLLAHIYLICTWRMIWKNL